MKTKTLRNKVDAKTVFYGPHACDVCDKLIAKTSKEEGGIAYDYPEGPIYPNTAWNLHVCLTAEEQIKKLRAKVKELEDLNAQTKTDFIKIIIEEKESWPKIQPYMPVYPHYPPQPYWISNGTSDNKFYCASGNDVLGLL
jgi:hypothetical protein